MPDIKVKRHSQDKGSFFFKVEVIEGDTKTEHTVEVKNDYYQALTDGKIKPELLVEKSFTFLLDREPKESILGRFDLELISNYFPEYEEKIHDYY